MPTICGKFSPLSFRGFYYCDHVACKFYQVLWSGVSELLLTQEDSHYKCLLNVPGDKFSTDWDKAWSNFKKRGRKTLFSQFSPDKYVSWNPRRSDFPISEEVDPIKRTERSNLMLWTSPGFTLVGAIIIVSFLLLYTILAPVKWSSWLVAQM